MIFIVDRQGVALYTNSFGANLFGRPAEEIIGRRVQDILDPDLYKHQKDVIARVFETGAPLHTSNQVRFQGREVWLDNSMVPLRDASGEVFAVMGIARDATARHQVEEALRESEERYRTLLETSPDAVVLVDPEAKVLYCNQRASDFFFKGKRPEEVVGKEAFSLLSPQDRTHSRGIADRALSAGNLRDIEFCLSRKDGSPFYIEVSVSVIPDAQGQPKAYLGVARDITERKRAEEKILESELRHRTTLDSMGDAIHVVDRDLRLVLLNARFKQWCRELGLETEVIGRTLFEAFPFLPETVREEYEQVFRTEETLVTEEASHVGEREIISETRKIPILQGGEVAQVVTVVHDITKRKRAEEELRKSLEKLRQALRETIQAIALIIETKDPYTAGHQRRSTQLAEALARELGLPEEQCEGIRMAGFIHDLGKIAVPSEILSKPNPLNEIERAIIQNHVRAGYEILRTVEFPWPVAQVVLQHHERLDGSGYPSGLTGEGILLEARILAVADVVEAMASYRPYRPARGIKEAFQEIAQGRDRLYDPQVVDACLKLFSEKSFSFEPKEEKG
jgi:PAS domain S-box-containing protein/putative nucleotidyltransferase with HDIG domain